MAKRVSTTICPECGRSVRSDRLDVHMDTKHRSGSKSGRRKDVNYRTDREHRPSRTDYDLVRSEKRARLAFIAVVIIAAIAIIAFVNPFGFDFSGNEGAQDQDADGDGDGDGANDGSGDDGSGGDGSGDGDDGTGSQPDGGDPTNPDTGSKNRYAVMDTTMGTITFELYEDQAPITTANFIKYINADFFDGLIFHRVIDGFMVQGGGFEPDMTQKSPLYAPIELETDAGLEHVDGAVAMARTSAPDSATSQFFINDGPQPHLNPSSPGADDGYAVFGQVVSGMNVVREISAVETHTDNGHGDVPVEDIIINWVELVDSI